MEQTKQTYSLLELNNLVKERLKENFPSPYWVIGEISEIKEHNSGHCYLELIQKDENSNSIVARARATIWAYTYRMLKPYFESATGIKLTSSLKVMVLAQVTFHESFGYSLNITDIEPTYTIGDLELKKRETINKLIADGVFDMNRELSLNILPNRIAIISSSQAAGYQDFIDQLENNKENFKFDVTLFEATMQGEQAVRSIIDALTRINDRIDEFDAVAILRGGGATVDLSCFDNYELASHIAQFPLPIITGIGHEKDKSIADMVAYQAVKTPTALAEYLIDAIAEAESIYLNLKERLQDVASETLEKESSRLIQITTHLNNFCQLKLKKEEHAIISLSEQLFSSTKIAVFKSKSLISRLNESLNGLARHVINNRYQHIEALNKNISKTFLAKIHKDKQKLDFLNRMIATLDPINTLKKGFTITKINGNIVKSSKSIKTNDIITTIFHDGEVKSKV
ncbi:exodeoxyribonuclease VII large subunit [Tenuifilum thalassicum]|uniref:Exodeoxyribonuclease 7 large subunit n=1 Tax=Tenuifilum thalassicum TaxID=2590900 RepID=A0A7D4BC59_9BACT|nr:exodeoxyribonuclease VII large subunit [Tenuifilum thalassicum]QKG80580.1 exodeoxyribonuclease VII large subunit [Tenuifilum thalassicum]